MSVTVFSPAKINLYLAVTGRRDDGFHNLVSVAAPLNFGDELTATVVESGAQCGFRLECDHPEVPLDDSNLVLRAASAFAEATGWPAREGKSGVIFKLTKRIPLGAGLGGGSSNAVAALRALNALSGDLLTNEKMVIIASTLGSDCALFLGGAPVIMRGRGEQTELLDGAGVQRIQGTRVLLFKPSFGISTPWAYRRMAMEAPWHYLPSSEAERRLANWLGSTAPISGLLFNNMEGVAFDKFVALPVMLGKLRAEFGIEARMSGSGSTCFAVIDTPVQKAKEEGENDLVTRLKHQIRQSWGEGVFVQEASLV